MKLYVYPSLKKNTEQILTSKDINLKGDLHFLYEFLMVNKMIIDIQPSNLESLMINSENVLEMIQTGDPGWEKLVPVQVANYVKENKVFGYKGNL